MSILFLAYYLNNSKYSSESINHRLQNVEKYYELKNHTEICYDSHLSQPTGIAVWYKKHENVVFPFSQRSNRLVVSSYLPFGITEVCHVNRSNIGSCLTKLDRRLWEDYELLTLMHPALCLLSIDTKTNELRLVNDGLGLAKVFEYEFEGGYIWSNKISAALIFAQSVPPLSRQGLGIESVTGYYWDTHTPYENVKKLKRGSFIKINPAEGSIYRKQLDCFQKWIIEGTTKLPIEGLERFFKELQMFGDFLPIPAGLSGGRDSRVAVAALLKYIGAENVQLRTSYPPELELILAKQLIEALDFPVNWRSTSRKLASAPNTDLTDRILSWIKLYEMFPAQNGANNPGFTSWFDGLVCQNISLGGEGGETAKVLYYTKRQMRTKPFREHLKDHTFTSFSSVRFVHAEHKKLVHSIIESHIRDAGYYGMPEYRFFDYFYFVQRYTNAPITTYSPYGITPFSTPEYFTFGIQQSQEDKFTYKLYNSLIETLQPLWKDIPFYDQLQHQVDRKMVIMDLGEPSRIWNTNGYSTFMDLLNCEKTLHDYYDINQCLSVYDNRENLEQLDIIEKHNLNIWAYRIVLKGMFVSYNLGLKRFIDDNKDSCFQFQFQSLTKIELAVDWAELLKSNDISTDGLFHKPLPKGKLEIFYSDYNVYTFDVNSQSKTLDEQVEEFRTAIKEIRLF
ncbi:MAG: hypothetical protein F6K48_15515 [Okeania sp. SIO3H1]|nr:hypothetical protein [Okeania sp. SIO3H1]